MTETMAGLITAANTVEFRAFDSPPPGPGRVIVDLSLCGTDIASFKTGHPHSPAVCGHECVGHISAAGTGVTGIGEGDRVVIGVPTACGRCPECRRGLGDHCRTVSFVARGRDDLAPSHGGFAPRITVAAGRVVPAHPALSDADAAQVEPATVAFHGVRRSRIVPGDVVAVQGAGPIGLFAAQLALAAGAAVVLVVEPNEQRRELALCLGATHAAPAGEAQAMLDALTGGVLADVVLECTGVAPLLQTAAELTRAGGTVGLLSFLAQPPTIDAARWLGRQLALVASNAFTHDDLGRTMALLADGRVRALPLHTRTVTLADLEPTLRELAEGSTPDIKVLVDTTGGR